MTKDQIKKETLHYMYGTWEGYGEMEENGKPVFVYSLQIDKNETRFTVTKNGVVQKDDKFSSSGMHWIEDYLWYVDTRKYFITYANEQRIEFGELSTLGNFNGQYKFFATLNRI